MIDWKRKYKNIAYKPFALVKEVSHLKCFLILIIPFALSFIFCPLLNINLGNPYLKILDLAKLFIADAPMKKKIFLSPQSTLKYKSINRPWPKGLSPVYAPQ